ncbi:MAG: class I SAM-dependent methyltransferase [Candidatus Dormibacteria bacterium]
MTSGSLAIYDSVRAYELAFSYRDFQAEVTAILDGAATVIGRPPRPAVDVAAGPGDHALQLAQRGLQIEAVDLSAAMCARVLAGSAELGVSVSVVQADIRSFGLCSRVDLAVVLLDSTSHLLTMSDLVSLLRAVPTASTPAAASFWRCPIGRTVWPQFPWLVPSGDGTSAAPADRPRLPLTFSLLASRPSETPPGPGT